jgi:amino acid adenylation domain-containing protein
MVERQASETPLSIAVIMADRSLTFAELDRRANKLGRYLRSLGVQRETIVAVYMERSLEMVVALLAILKSGGAYLPIDSSLPRERVTYLLHDSEARVVVTTENLSGRLPAAVSKIVAVDREQPAIQGRPAFALDSRVHPENTAYVIYTSGSTGNPKGVRVPHRAIVNHMLWMRSEYPLGRQDRVLQKTPVSFDASVWEFWAPLIEGAVLVLAPPEIHLDVRGLIDTVRSLRITILQLVPTLLRVSLDLDCMDQCSSLRRIYVGGEAFTSDLQNRLFLQLPNVQAVNLYGPTEAAIDSTYWECRRGDRGNNVPIGGPIANARVFVLDADLESVPEGFEGELFIGGSGLAVAYHTRPALTAEKFVPDPASLMPGSRLYRTGDIVRWVPGKACLEFLGRNDQQVKLRGFRVELGEIERQLERHPDVSEAAVLCLNGAERDQRLVAYIVAARHGTADTMELGRFLRNIMPEYMVPSMFVPMDQLPRNSSGKVDRKALPQPEARRPELKAQYCPPETTIEQRLTAIWREFLEIDAIGIHDNFFELGGHSLMLIRIHRRLQQEFGEQLPVVVLLEHPTVHALAT